MTRISGSTVIHKKLLPLGMFALLSVGLYQGFSSFDSTQPFSQELIVELLLLPFFVFVYKKICWELMDEVDDAGTEVIFRRGRQQQRVNIADVTNIYSSKKSSPERVTVITRTTGEMGRKLGFVAPFRFNLSSTDPLLRGLIERVEQARRAACQETR